MIDFLRHSKQIVRHIGYIGVLSGQWSISTGVPLVYVATPVLLSLYKHVCTEQEN